MLGRTSIEQEAFDFSQRQFTSVSEEDLWDCDLIELFVSCLNNSQKAYRRFDEIVRELGYDGIIADDEYIAFYPNQIKLVSNVTPTKSNNINEEFIDDNESAIFSKDAYDIRNFIYRCKHNTRIIYDKINDWYICGDAYNYNHDKLVDLAKQSYIYNKSDDIDISGLDPNIFRIFCKHKKVTAETDLDLSTDGYEYRYTYPNDINIYIDENVNWEICDLSKILGEPIEIVNIEFVNMQELFSYLIAKKPQIQKIELLNGKIKFSFNDKQYIVQNTSVSELLEILDIESKISFDLYWNQDYNDLAFQILDIIQERDNS